MGPEKARGGRPKDQIAKDLLTWLSGPRQKSRYGLGDLEATVRLFDHGFIVYVPRVSGQVTSFPSTATPTSGAARSWTSFDRKLTCVARRHEPRVKNGAAESPGMFTLLSAAEGTVLPIDAVGWFVTLLGVLFAVAWAAYLYR